MMSLLGLGLAFQSSQAQQASAALETTLTHDNSLWVSQVWEDEPKNGQSEFFLLDRGVWRSTRQDEQRADRLDARWTLGLGQRRSSFGEVVVGQAIERSTGPHRWELSWGGQALLYQGSVGFQDLEAQYRLNTNNQGLVFADDVRSQELAAFAAARDRWRLTPSLNWTFNAEARRSDFAFGEQRRDTSELWGLGTGFEKRGKVWIWEASVQQNEVRFVDRSGTQTPRDQYLVEARSFLSSELMGRWQLGLGFESFQTRFRDATLRTIQGPALTVQRRQDDRVGGGIRVGYLQETGDDRRGRQTFGAANLSYRLNRQNSLSGSLSREVDLLSSFNSGSLDSLALATEQQFTTRASLQWDLRQGRHTFRTLYTRSLQNFRSAEVDNERVRSTWTLRLQRLNELVYGLEWRHNREDLVDRADGNRQVLGLTAAWRHTWPGEWRSLGARPYVTLEGSLEQLEDRSLDRRFRRASVLAGIGQDWSL